MQLTAALGWGDGLVRRDDGGTRPHLGEVAYFATGIPQAGQFQHPQFLQLGQLFAQRWCGNMQADGLVVTNTW